MNDLRRYLRSPYYWRRAWLRLTETVTRRIHPEALLGDVLASGVRLGTSAAGGAPGPATGLRLLYVAPRHENGNPARGLSYEENHFLPALAALGFDVLPLDSLGLVRRAGRRVASEVLVEAAFRYRPEVAFFVLFRDDFEPEAVEEVRRLGCTTFNWFADDHWRFESFSRRWAPRFAWAVTTDPRAPARYREHRIAHVIRSQWGVNHHLFRPLNRPCRFDVTFIGQPHGRRRAVLRALARAGLDVRAWGYGWRGGRVSTHRAVEIVNESAVNLNLSNAVTGTVDQIKGRDFEVPACRALLLTQRVEALDDYYDPGTEVLVYDGLDDLVDRARWALGHPGEADRIRDAGYRRVLREHTYERRFLDIFRRAGVVP
ncbi:MAG: glycosyltransferase [Armatimonadota bacterium]|nr:glycosyltransferase [Armatimonadota bacterium]